MEITVTNSPEPSECPTCGTVTSRRYRVDPDPQSAEYGACEICIGREINARNDGLYGLSEWHNDRRQLTTSELVQLVETQFIRGAKSIRYGYPSPSRLVQKHDHEEQLASLVEKDQLAFTTGGVDEAKAVFPTAERQLELINTYDLLSTWDVSPQRKATIKEDIRDALGQGVTF